VTRCPKFPRTADINSEALVNLREWFFAEFHRRGAALDLADELAQEATIRYWRAIQRGKRPSKWNLIQWTWLDHCEKAEQKPALSLDEPIPDLDGGEVPREELAGSFDLVRLVELILPDTITERYRDLCEVGANWSELGRRWGCDRRTAKKWVQNVLFSELERVGRLLGYGDGVEGVAALLYAMRDSRYPTLFKS